MRLDHLLSKEEEEVGSCITIALSGCKKEIPVAMRSGETPVPIPNTTVKTRAAESTMLETAWEDRWLPDLKKGL